MSEGTLLNILKEKDKYNSYAVLLEEHSVQPETWQILKDMGEWFKTKDDLDWGDFSTWFLMVRHSSMSADKQEMYKNVFKNISHLRVDPTLTQELLERLITKTAALEISSVCTEILEGRKHTLDDVPKMLEKHELKLHTIEGKDPLIQEFTAAAIKEVSCGSGYKWRCRAMNICIGDLRKGNFITIGGRPDAGKTSFIASEATYMAPQMNSDEYILLVSNEEDLRMRLLTTALNVDRKTIESDLPKHVEMYKNVVGTVNGEPRIIIADSDSISTRDVDRLMHRYNVKLLVFNQLWKVTGYKKEAELEKLRLLYQWARGLGKKYNTPVLNVHQIGNDGENKLYLEMADFYGSKTAIQGEVDALVGLGKTNKPGYENIRGISVPKNKLGSGPLFDESMRKGHIEVNFNSVTGRYT